METGQGPEQEPRIEEQLESSSPESQSNVEDPERAKDLKKLSELHEQIDDILRALSKSLPDPIEIDSKLRITSSFKDLETELQAAHKQAIYSAGTQGFGPAADKKLASKRSEQYSYLINSFLPKNKEQLDNYFNLMAKIVS